MTEVREGQTYFVSGHRYRSSGIAIQRDERFYADFIIVGRNDDDDPDTDYTVITITPAVGGAYFSDDIFGNLPHPERNAIRHELDCAHTFDEDASLEPQTINLNGGAVQTTINAVVTHKGRHFASVGTNPDYCVVTKSHGTPVYSTVAFDAIALTAKEQVIRLLDDAEWGEDETWEDEERTDAEEDAEYDIENNDERSEQL